MRILMENGCYDLNNHGDVAMIQVAVSRLRSLWPDATIQVITRSPDRLAMLCPGTVPVALHAAPSWYKQSLLKRLYERLPPALCGAAERAGRAAQRSLPALGRRLALWDAKLHGDVGCLREADLVVSTGGGYIADSFEIVALLVLDTLGIAARLGKPVALLGQGLGPLERPALRAIARQVLPAAGLIVLRERQLGAALLRELGVAAERVATTGDEAVSMAYQARPANLGAGIGVNLRVATYAEVSPALARTLAETLRAAARRHDAPLLPVPINMGSVGGDQYAPQGDMETIGELIGPREGPQADQRFECASDVIAQVGRCRVVVTGSYHAAVFALSQGIPAICLAKSQYYTHKFLGLADLFGAGCEVLFLDDAQIRARLADAIDRLWDSAAHVRPQLLAAAERQIADGEAAYRRLFQLVSAR